jgi:hypothetical protein
MQSLFCFVSFGGPRKSKQHTWTACCDTLPHVPNQPVEQLVEAIFNPLEHLIVHTLRSNTIRPHMCSNLNRHNPQGAGVIVSNVISISFNLKLVKASSALRMGSSALSVSCAAIDFTIASGKSLVREEVAVGLGGGKSRV